MRQIKIGLEQKVETKEQKVEPKEWAEPNRVVKS